MAFILEFKERFKKFYNKYDTYFVPAVKFLVALISFLIINSNIGYMDKLKNPMIAVILSIVCAFLPGSVTLIFLSVFMLAHLYAISAEFALLALCIVLLMYLMYFRFTPKTSYLVILSAFFCWLKLPFVMFVAVGLCSSALAVIPVGCGIIIYYIIRTASEYEAAISNQSITESMQQISYLVESLIKNKQMLVLVITALVTIVFVYVVRRLKVDHAWTYAIAAGSIVELLVLIVGQITMKSDFNIVLIILGVVLGAGASYICNILFFALDYKRTEFVQYEDDEYYYFVKAVPKINVAGQNVTVKHINTRKTKKASDIKSVKKPVASESKKHAVEAEDDDDITFLDGDE